MLKKIKIEHLFIACMFVLFAGLLASYQKDFAAQKQMLGAPDNLCDFDLSISLSGRTDFYSVGARTILPLVCLIPWSLSKNNISSFFVFRESEYLLSTDGIIFILWVVALFSFILLFQLANLKTGPPHIKFLSTIVFLFSGIYLHVFRSGNFNILASAFLAFFLINYRRKNNIVIREIIVLTLALAVTIKPYLAFMGILLLFDKEWKLLNRAAVYSLLLVFVPFFFLDLPSDIQVSGIMNKFFANVAGYFNILFLLSADNMSFPANIGNNVFTPEIRAILKPLIYAFSVIFSVLAIVCAPFLKEKDEWKKFLLMICCFILLGGGGLVVQHCFIYFFPCIIMFLNSNTKINLSNMGYLIGFVLILNPLQIGKVSGITITWLLVKIAFWIIFFHLIFDGFKELLKEKGWRKRIWFLNLKGN